MERKDLRTGFEKLKDFDPSSLTQSRVSINSSSLQRARASTTNPYELQAMSPQTRRTLMFSICIMLVCGSSNDFLGKCAYQMLPGDDEGWEGLKLDYWTTFWLTAGSFLICSFAIINGRESFRILTVSKFFVICIPATMDLFVTGGRYLGLIFLPAAVISILKNGFQLLFLAIFRRCWRKKKLTNMQWFGLSVTMMGLILVSSEGLIEDFKDKTKLTMTIIGTAILISVGFFGAIRNTMEEILLQKDSFHSDFMVGMESIISLSVTTILGVYLLFSDPFEQHQKGYESFTACFKHHGFILCFVLFVLAIYGKDTMQMKVAKLTSSLTRKLFQQLYPLGTWALSLITYSFNAVYGETWDKYSFVRLAGFIVVVIGTYLYIKPPKVDIVMSKKEKLHISRISSLSIDDEYESEYDEHRSFLNLFGPYHNDRDGK